MLIGILHVLGLPPRVLLALLHLVLIFGWAVRERYVVHLVLWKLIRCWVTYVYSIGHTCFVCLTAAVLDLLLKPD